MKVLVLGMPRTGTQSLADALERLGISPVYHMREVGKNKHQAFWIEALDAKFEGRGELFNREKFDQILGPYETLADYPAAIFPEELMAAYPEASVILSVRRSEDEWLASMKSTLVCNSGSRSFSLPPIWGSSHCTGCIPESVRDTNLLPSVSLRLICLVY